MASIVASGFLSKFLQVYCGQWFYPYLVVGPLIGLVFPNPITLLLNHAILWTSYVFIREDAKMKLAAGEPSYLILPNDNDEPAVSGPRCMAIALVIYYCIKTAFALAVRFFVCEATEDGQNIPGMGTKGSMFAALTSLGTSEEGKESGTQPDFLEMFASKMGVSSGDLQKGVATLGKMRGGGARAPRDPGAFADAIQ